MVAPHPCTLLVHVAVAPQPWPQRKVQDIGKGKLLLSV